MYIEFIVGDTDYKVPAKYIVCSTCEGKGTRVNPAIDGNGITQSEMEELGEQFQEDYFGGLYDIQCSECEGIRVVKAINREEATEEKLKAFDKYLDEEYMIAQEEYYERMAGC